MSDNKISGRCQFEGFLGFRREVLHKAGYHGLRDVLLERSFIQLWPVDPVVAALACPLIVVEDPLVHHCVEEVDYGCAADCLAHKPVVDVAPDLSRDGALLVSFLDEPQGFFLVVTEDL